jgi:hypothetical protein
MIKLAVPSILATAPRGFLLIPTFSAIHSHGIIRRVLAGAVNRMVVGGHGVKIGRLVEETIDGGS